MDYNQLRHLADSWGLLVMTVVFLGAILWALRPGSRGTYQEHAEIPFKHDEEKD